MLAFFRMGGGESCEQLDGLAVRIRRLLHRPDLLGKGTYLAIGQRKSERSSGSFFASATKSR